MNHSALVYSHSVSPRLQYVVDFFSQYYGLSFKLIYDEEKFINAPDQCKINYGYHRLVANEIFIHSHVLLFETSVRSVKIECFEQNGYKAFFKTEGDFGFDLVAAVFFLITRYEEYLPHRKDIYGRYAHENSIAFREGFINLPLINFWLEDFRRLLSEKNSQFSILNSQFKFLPTYDIDMAWSFRNKGFKRNFANISLLFLKAQFRKAFYRIKVIRGKKQDPFDAYEWMDQLHQQFQLHPIYFFLVAKETGKYDKNIDVSNKEFQQLVHSISAKYQIGLHPSWSSGDVASLLTQEKSTLEQIANEQVISSRQHFIRFDLPTTYRRLIALGITNDYSMGYGSINGFRASVATKFYWYDLKKEEKTNLQVHPFCFMEANSFYEQKFSADEALNELVHYHKVSKEVNGTLITIWHNSFLGRAEEFKGWREMYQQFISSIAKG